MMPTSLYPLVRARFRNSREALAVSEIWTGANGAPPSTYDCRPATVAVGGGGGSGEYLPNPTPNP